MPLVFRTCVSIIKLLVNRITQCLFSFLSSLIIVTTVFFLLAKIPSHSGGSQEVKVEDVEEPGGGRVRGEEEVATEKPEVMKEEVRYAAGAATSASGAPFSSRPSSSHEGVSN